MMRIPNRTVTVNRTPIYIGNQVFTEVDKFVRNLHPAGIFILTDLNTKHYCLPLLLEHSVTLKKASVICTDGGEAAKSIENATKIWIDLLHAGAERSSLIINLGGGVVSDLGGFIAAGFKRGITYINVPTSLIGQADASIGGKTGINVGNLKNQVGFIYPAAGVFIFPGFLQSLPADHLRSGLAEIIKSALIGNEKLWHRISRQQLQGLLSGPFDSGFWVRMVLEAVQQKNKVVMHDLHERKKRKMLNFGHTIGHALEGFSMNSPGQPLLHGDAVAAGMICATYLSHLKTGLPLADMEAIVGFLRTVFPPFPLDGDSLTKVSELIKQDKKQQNRKVQFTLLSKPGKPVINVTCVKEEICDALMFYNVSISS
jgi:3-dehydroquinate synthase